MEPSVLSFGSFLRAVSVDSVKRLSLSHLIDAVEGQRGLMRVPIPMVMKCSNLDISRLFARMDADSTLPFVAVARLCEFDWDALGLHEWFLYVYKNKSCFALVDRL